MARRKEKKEDPNGRMWIVSGRFPLQLFLLANGCIARLGKSCSKPFAIRLIHFHPLYARSPRTKSLASISVCKQEHMVKAFTITIYCQTNFPSKHFALRLSKACCRL